MMKLFHSRSTSDISLCIHNVVYTLLEICVFLNWVGLVKEG